MDKIFFQQGALLSLGDEVVLGWGDSVWSQSPDSKRHYSFYFPDFFLEKKTPWLHFEKTKKLSLTEARNMFPRASTPSSRKWIFPDLLEYQESFDLLMRDLKRGILKKAVPYSFAKSEKPLDTNEIESILSRIFEKKSTLYPYGYWEKGKGLLGATPEVLFSIRGNTLKTMALAGTMGMHHTPDTFLQDPKEREEHDIVVNSIVKTLDNFGDVIVGERGLHAAGSLFHMKTAIEVTLNKIPEMEVLINALHPTPALGAFPKEEGNRFLKNYESKFPRGHYGAPSMLMDHSRGEVTALVSIRGLQWDEEMTRLGAGAGVIKESVIEKEWQEILSKMKATVEVLQGG